MENQETQQSQPKPSVPSNDYYTKFDEKTINTIKISAIWGGVSAVIMSIAGMLAVYYFTRSLYTNMMGQYLGNYMGQPIAPRIFNLGVLLNSAIWGIIGGAVAGYIIAKFYPTFVGWQKKYVSNKLNTFFKILFWPYLVGLAISMVMSGALNMMNSGFNLFIIIVVADLISIYLYAKMMDKNVGKYYQ